MVASIRRRTNGHRWAWLVGVVLGLFIGELTMATGWIGIAFGIAGAVMVALKGPVRAATGGYLLGVGGTIALIEARRFGLCPDLDLDPAADCPDGMPSLFLVEAAAALVVLGSAATTLALRRSGGDGRPKAGRQAGAAVGLGITLVAAAVEIALYEPSFGRFDALKTALLPGWGAPTIAAGVLAGWILGPAARSAATRLDWLWLTFGMAVLAVAIGAVAVGLLGGIINGATIGLGGAPAIVALIPYALVIAVFGLVFSGPFVLGPAFVAASMWSFLMARGLRRADRS